jgi:arylformamidase
MNRGWIDISTPLASGLPVWPGDPAVRIERVLSLDRGDDCNLSSMEMTVHAGTHIDAPLHFLSGARSMDDFDFDAAVGPARVIAIRGPEELSAISFERGERILFKTRDSGLVHIPPEAARHLAESGVRLVGIDRLSVGTPGEEGHETHRILLGAGVWILEGLDLTAAAPGRYDLFCLPLRIAGAEGAPARAILRPR